MSALTTTTKSAVDTIISTRVKPSEPAALSLAKLVDMLLKVPPVGEVHHEHYLAARGQVAGFAVVGQCLSDHQTVEVTTTRGFAAE